MIYANKSVYSSQSSSKMLKCFLDETVMLSSALVSPKPPKSWAVLNYEPARMLGLSISIT